MVTPPRGELSDTALKLSQVIEREAKRSSALRSSRTSRMRSSFASSFNRSSRRWSESSRPGSSKRSSVVAPMPKCEPPSMKESESRKTVSAVGELRRDSKVTEMQRQGSKARTTMVERSPSPNDTKQQQELVVVVVVPPPHPTATQRLWLLMDDPQSSQMAHYLSVCIFCFVIVSTIVFIAQTEEELTIYAQELDFVEMVCAGIFTIELLLRAFACPSKRAFLKDYANWIDISAIFPFYLERILEVDNAGTFGAIRIVRLTRVARVLKMSRYSSAIQVFVQAIAISMKALSMLIFLMAIAMIVFSSMIYFAEFTHDGCRAGGWVGDCDNGGSVMFASSIAGAAAARAASSTDCICVDPNPYKSIASSFWWCIVTMSTVGYGDMTPVTLLGKIVGCASVLTGMLVLALPITVIGTNFQKVMKSVVQQTMKSNVDYLKGKRIVCRNEIEAILQRFHAVTEDIHLDVDDVISVYDEDNNGMLEDEELAKFRIDLEILQNRFMMNQHSGGGGGGVGGGSSSTEVSSLRVSPCQEDNGSTWTLGSSLHPQTQTRLYYHSPVLMHSNTSEALERPVSGPLMTTKSSGDVTPRRSSAMAVVGPSMSLGSGMVMIPRETRSSSVSISSPSQHLAGLESGSNTPKTASIQSIDQQTSSPSVPVGLSREVPISGRLRHYFDPLTQVSRHHSGSLSQDTRYHSGFLHPDVRLYSGPQTQDVQHISGLQTQAVLASPPTMSPTATSSPVIDSELFWQRMMDMQHAWEERLLETEQRLEAKLQNLTKMLVRIEGMVELDS